MKNVGFIYILINPSLSDLVKIGKTTRSPEERAKELSDATGIPTPFFVAFDEKFDDCNAAEKYIHTLLEYKGFRVADNREFFNIPLKEAIKALLETKNALSGSTKTKVEELNQPIKNKQPEIWRDIIEQADTFRYGLGDTLEDEKQAIKLYKQAAKLGSADAFEALANLFIKASYHSNRVKNRNQALEYFKEAVKLGNHKCYGKMAFFYLHQNSHDNADKCWHNYFKYLIDSPDAKTPEAEKYVMEYVNKVLAGELQYKYGDLIQEIYGKSFEDIENLLKEFPKYRNSGRYNFYIEEQLNWQV